MIYLVHHVPGRLRIKSPLIKGNPHEAEVLRRRAESITGVSSVIVNPVTGSAAIRYTQNAISVPGILSELERLGYRQTDTGWGASSVPGAKPLVDSGTLTEKILGSVVESLIQRSAVALVTALI